MSQFNYECEIPIRYRDLDPMGHVNNAVYATYLEQARVRYIEDVVGESATDLGVVVASLELDFEGSIRLDGTLTVAVRVPELGRTSVPQEYELRVDGEVVATAETTMVAVDPDTRDSRPIPGPWRERIREHEGR